MRSVADYDAGQSTDVGAEVTPYTMTAPGDPIQEVQGLNGFGLGLGADPDTMDGVTRLETGRYADGTMVQGLRAHSNVFHDGSTSWTTMVAVVQGAAVTPYVDPTMTMLVTPVSGAAITEHPYADPTHPGPPTVPVPAPIR